MTEQYKKDYNVVIHEADDEIIFTTNNRVAAELLSKICDDANITDNKSEYHYQGWLKKNKKNKKNKK